MEAFRTRPGLFEAAFDRTATRDNARDVAAFLDAVMIVIGSTNFAIACAAFIAANYAIFVVTFYEVVRGFLFWINIVFAVAGWVCIVFGCRGVRFNHAMAIAGVEDAGDADYVWLSVVILGAVTKVLGYLGFAAAWYEHRLAVRAYGGAMAILLALWIVSCALVIVVIVDSNQGDDSEAA